MVDYDTFFLIQVSSCVDLDGRIVCAAEMATENSVSVVEGIEFAERG